MSYLSKPGSRVAHIIDWRRSPSGAPLAAKCPARFPRPWAVAYFTDREGRKVCGHCARIARREALRLLKQAAGEDC